MKKSWKKKTKGGRWFNFTFPSPRFPPFLFPRLSIRVINNWIFFSPFPVVVVVVVSVRQFSMPFRGRAKEEEERREAFRLGSHGVSHNHDTNTRTHRRKKKQTKQTTLDTGDNRRPSTNWQTNFFSSSSGALPVIWFFPGHVHHLTLKSNFLGQQSIRLFVFFSLLK